MNGTPSRLVVASALSGLVLAGIIIPGCSNDSCTCPAGPEIVYPERTSPENVIEKLNLAYVNMDLEAYMDCLAESFTFFVSPDELNNPYYDGPESWNTAVEETIHRRMFSGAAGTQLMFQPITIEWNAGDELWRYTEDADVRVTISPITYFATAPQLFVVAVDAERTGPAGEELWAIVEWHELSEYGGRVSEVGNWSSIKLLFLMS